MSVQACMDLAIDQYEQQHLQARDSSSRNAIQVRGIVNDLWAALAKLGNQVDWPKAVSHYYDMLRRLFEGQSIEQVVAWVLATFPAKSK